MSEGGGGGGIIGGIIGGIATGVSEAKNRKAAKKAAKKAELATRRRFAEQQAIEVLRGAGGFGNISLQTEQQREDIETALTANTGGVFASLLGITEKELQRLLVPEEFGPSSITFAAIDARMRELGLIEPFVGQTTRVTGGPDPLPPLPPSTFAQSARDLVTSGLRGLDRGFELLQATQPFFDLLKAIFQPPATPQVFALSGVPPIQGPFGVVSPPPRSFGLPGSPGGPRSTINTRGSVMPFTETSFGRRWSYSV